MSDPYVGRLTYLRVYSGSIGTGSNIINATKDRKERLGRLLMMHANHREDVETASRPATSSPPSASSPRPPATR